MNPSENTLHFDLELATPCEILSTIQKHLATLHSQAEAPESESLTNVAIVGAKGQNFVGLGIRGIGKVTIQGPVGDFGLCSFGDGECNVEGNVGNFFGHSMHSGVLVVRGHARNAVGALAVGGLITIYGNAGERIGMGLQGADVVIRGSVDRLAGLGMHGGTLIIGGNAGRDFGHGMRGGTIYIRGEAETYSPEVEEHRLREPDRLKIGLLMLKSGIKSTGKEFRAYRSIQAEV